MKKVGVGVVAILLLFTFPVIVSAQCANPCASNSDCTIDQQCNSGCCTPIPCSTSADCPFSCPFSVNAFFVTAACNTCQNGFCVDPNCACDYKPCTLGSQCTAAEGFNGVCTSGQCQCGGLGPCAASQHLCLATDSNCHDCNTGCDCSQPKPGGGSCTADTDCTDARWPKCATKTGEATTGRCCTGITGSGANQICKDTCSNTHQCQTGTGTCSCIFTTPSCTDGVDNDCDGNIDCADTADSSEVCSAGTGCASDSNPCTNDVCGSGTCTHPNNGNSCDDGNACTSADLCSGGSCAGTPIVCNDQNPCTTDSCNSLTGCVFTNNNDPCNDNNACTNPDACSQGSCVGGPVVVCNDGVGCTDDSCNSQTGCVFSPNDGNCNDQNPCTDDTCDSQQDCIFTNDDSNSCDNGLFCDGQETCSSGQCTDNPDPCLCCEQCDEGQDTCGLVDNDGDGQGASC